MSKNEEKHKSVSGATSSGNKAPYDLIPLCFLQRTARRFGLGVKKHGKWNWKKGLKDKEFILDRLNHAIEHIKIAQDQIERGEKFSDDDLGGAAANIAMAMDYQHVNNIVGDYEI